MNPLYVYLALINIVAFIMAVWDKRQARLHRYRISENNLMLSAVLGGGVGLMLAFLIVRHKTKKLKFMLGVPIIIVLQIFLAVLAIYYFK